MAEAREAESISLSPRVRFRAVMDEGVVVHLESGRVIVVSEVGLRVLQALSSPCTRGSLVELITDEFEVDRQQAAADLDIYLGELEQEQVINPSTEERKTR